MTIYTFEDGILFKLYIGKQRRSSGDISKKVRLYYVLSTEPGTTWNVEIYPFKHSWGRTKDMKIKELLQKIKETKNDIKKKADQEKSFFEEIEKGYIEANQENHISRDTFINKRNQWANLNQVLDDDEEL